MKIPEKLKEVLSEEDLASFQSEVKQAIDEEVTLRVEEKTKQLEDLAEQFCAEKIEAGVAAEKETLIEEYEGKMEELESNIVEKLDRFIDTEISEQISEDVFEKVAMNETYEPIIKGIQTLFEDKFVALDSDGSKVVEDQSDKIKELEEKVADLIADKMELNELAESAASQLFIERETAELTESQKERVATFFEGKSFSELESRLPAFVSMISEDTDTDEKTISEGELNFDDADGIESIDDLLAEDKSDESEEEVVSEEKTEEDTDLRTVISEAQKFLN